MKQVLLFLSLILATLVGVYAANDIKPISESVRARIEQQADYRVKLLQCIQEKRKQSEYTERIEGAYEQCEMQTDY